MVSLAEKPELAHVRFVFCETFKARLVVEVDEAIGKSDPVDKIRTP
ncbi:hypothetical protein CES85_3733 (plasmid) [Ochrobactrum quorumnocens]|uniref:Uncharacterized protein n=1 Tax=Ochrobactrum quorumnocens TaxID=271865 RepID=A0A248UM33_9HYPH|nr:hypothetical protein [[Ochrobactrum] quorumnocens]ASV87734.1 hypothetical protein CES85_3733 [[Ochrobactrum] quorumnocens]